MKRVLETQEFIHDPVGKFVAGPSYLYFCASPELYGFLVFGRATADDMRQLTEVLAMELGDQVAPHRSLVDASRLEFADSGAFLTLHQYVSGNHQALQSRVTQLALIRPEGIAGAVVSGFYQMLDPPYPVKIFRDGGAAIEWLGPPATRTLLEELDQHYADVTGTRPVVGALRSVLSDRLSLSIDEAARALGLSKRTLQRRLQESETSFQDELSAARVREAERRLLSSNTPITVIALDLGLASLQHFSALFRRMTGETPSEWRARRRGTEAPI